MNCNNFMAVNFLLSHYLVKTLNGQISAELMTFPLTSANTGAEIGAIK